MLWSECEGRRGVLLAVDVMAMRYRSVRGAMKWEEVLWQVFIMAACVGTALICPVRR